MALNPYFLQGSRGEQRLVQSLINEHLKIYGQEVTYIPRKYVNQESIIEEVTSSKFDDNFAIEMYVNTYDGYSGAGDVLTKFGMSLRDEVELTVSRERFEEFIAPFMDASDDIDLASRPREGDLIFFPLGQRLFEIKFVEHEEPFYQLGSNYVYKLKCELFEYEDEVIDTGLDAVDDDFETAGYNVTMTLTSAGSTATAVTSLESGAIFKIDMITKGSGYTNAPRVQISPPIGAGRTAQAVAITSTTGTSNFRSLIVDSIEITDPGAGYTTTPTVQFLPEDGRGSGATAQAGIGTIGSVGIFNPVSFA